MYIWKLKDLLKTNEGFRSHPYLCTANRTTVGFGRNLSDKGISEQEAKFLLDNDVREVINALRDKIQNFESLPSHVKIVLGDMGFQLGIVGLLKFKKMLHHIEAGRQGGLEKFENAAKELLDSKYAKQTPNRANRNAEILRTGILPEFLK